MDEYVTQYDINVRPWRDAKASHGRYQDIFDLNKLHAERGKFRSTKMSPEMDFTVDKGRNNGIDDFDPSFPLERAF